MKKLITLFLCFGLFLFTALPAHGQDVLVAGDSADLAKFSQEDCLDYRRLQLYQFLKEEDSLLVNFSDDFIDAADIWGIDWRLVPAIAGLESSFAKRMVPGTYNAYGWAGGYFGFRSWDDSINHVSRKLSENYYSRGLNTPERIGPVYAPPNPNWGNLIASIMKKI